MSKPIATLWLRYRHNRKRIQLLALGDAGWEVVGEVYSVEAAKKLIDCLLHSTQLALNGAGAVMKLTGFTWESEEKGEEWAKSPPGDI